MATFGAPQVSTQSDDATTAQSAQVKSVFLVQAITQRGVINQPVRVASVLEFYREFGFVIHPTGELCLRALKAGAVLIVNPVHHYTDISNQNSKQGLRASSVLLEDGIGNTVLGVEAVEVGEGYNNIAVQFFQPQSRKPNSLDIVVSKPNDTSFPKEVINDVPHNFYLNDLALLNQRLSAVKFTLNTDGINLSSLAGIYASLGGGAKDISMITTNDFAGAEISRTGLYAFTDTIDGFHLINFNPQNLLSFALDANMVDFATRTQRQCHLWINETTAGKIVNFRQGRGDYNHSPIDNLQAAYYAGDITVPSLQNSLNLLENISPMGDIAGCIAQKDAVAVWLSAAQLDFGKLGTDVQRIRSFTPTEKDLLYDNDINFIERSVTQGFKLTGNRSMFRDTTKVSSKLNVASLTIFMYRWLKVFGEKYLHEPNDIPTWTKMYLDAKPTLLALETGRAILGGEGKGWLWRGDQDAKNYDSLQYNSKSEVQQGIYRVQVLIKPVSAIEYLVFTITKTNDIVAVS